MKLNDLLKIVVMLIAIVSGIGGYHLYIDTTFARQNETVLAFKDFRKQMRIDALYSQLRYLEGLAQQIRWHLYKNPNDVHAKSQLINIKNDISRVQAEIHKLTYGGS